MKELLQERIQLEATIAAFLISGQPYEAHMYELLDLNKEIRRLGNVHPKSN